MIINGKQLKVVYRFEIYSVPGHLDMMTASIALKIAMANGTCNKVVTIPQNASPQSYPDNTTLKSLCLS